MCIPKIYHHIINENAIEISEGWGGRASDKYITTKSGSIKNLLRKKTAKGQGDRFNQVNC